MDKKSLHKEVKKFISKTKTEGKIPLLVIFGPTASGKTGISIEIAKEHNGEVISADSRQVYKEMPISVALVTKEEMQDIPHHLIEINSPNKALSLAEYRNKALELIEKINSQNKTPILVGGTGLYISSIIDDYKMPKAPPNKELRSKLEKIAKEKGNEEVHNILKDLDKKKASSIHPNNLRYVIRAIEIIKSKGENSIVQKEPPKFSTLLINMDWPREVLYNRINQRVDEMVKGGIFDEIKALLDKGYSKNLPSMSSIGVKELIPYIEGLITKEEVIETLKKNTRNYAKRQITWFSRYKNKVINICPLKEKSGS